MKCEWLNKFINFGQFEKRERNKQKFKRTKKAKAVIRYTNFVQIKFI